MRKEKGFTLIELLVVVAIIGILAAIAIPQFAEYRKRAFDASARSDLRNIMTSEEAYYVDNDAYANFTSGQESVLPGFKGTSDGVTASAAVRANGNGAAGQAWSGTSTHPKGNNKTFCYDSEADSSLKDTDC